MEVWQTKDTILISDSDDTIADDKQDVRKVMASEVLDSLCCELFCCNSWRQADECNAINQLTRKVETRKLENLEKALSICFLRNESVSYHN